jgi:transcriptional regulator with XRE-family HTH domain
MTPSNPPNLGVHEGLPDQLCRAVGARLLARRTALGLKRSAVARAVGYTNLSKGSKRVFDWERGKFGPMLDAAAYCAALQLDPASIKAERQHAEAIRARIDRLGRASNNAEHALLRDNIATLRASATRIAADPRLAGVRSPAMAIRVLWMGGGALSLGGLTTAWAAGSLVAETDAHGPVYLFDGGGSALSGAGLCTGIDETGAVRQVRQSPTRFFRGRGPRPWGDTHPRSAWSLADAVVALGGNSPCSEFYLLDEQGRPFDQPLATYDPVRRVLQVTGGPALQVDAMADEPVQSRDLHGGVSVGGGAPRPLALGGLQLGGFRAESVEHGSGLRMCGGRVEGPQGWFPVQVRGPCPPPSTLPLIAGILRQLTTVVEPVGT